MRIKNTLKLGEFYASKALEKQLSGNKAVEVIEKDISLFNGNDLAEF